MHLLTGTSGFSHAEWKGGFYPAGLPAAEMLRFYAERFGTVEINSTFTRMPAASVLEGWAEQVPRSFRFAIKAPRWITHNKRLNDVAEPVNALLEVAGVLGARLGPILFQLPPNFKKDLARLDHFLHLLPAGVRAAIEFRHATWLDDEVFAALRSRGVALCIVQGEKVDTPLVSTADFGYLRLRRAKYGKAELRGWAAEIRAREWGDAFVYFRHDESGTAPKLARRMAEVFAEG